VSATTGTIAQTRPAGAPVASPRVLQKLRVCMVVHAYYEGDARVRRYAESLAALGHRVDVLALRAPQLPVREQIAGVALQRLPLSRRRGGLLRYVYEYLVFTLLCGIVLAFRPRRYDVVHVHNMPDFLVFAALVPRLFGARVVLDVHDLMPEVYASKFKTGLRHPGIWPLRVQEWLSHRFASAVVFATERFRACAIARGAVSAARSIAVMNAADTRVFDRQRHPWPDPLHADQRLEQVLLRRRRETVQSQRLVRDEVRVDVQLHLTRPQPRLGRRARQHLVPDAADVDDDRIVVRAAQLATQKRDHARRPAVRRGARRA